MKRLFALLFIFVSFSAIAAKSDNKVIPRDTTTYQFGNDTLIQTLTISWLTDTSFKFSFTTENVRNRAERNVKGEAYKQRGSEEPLIKSYLNKEFPAIKYVCNASMCPMTFFVQYLHRERVWVETDCKKKEIFTRLPLRSLGMLEKLQ